MQSGLHRFLHWGDKKLLNKPQESQLPGQDSAAKLYLREINNSFKDNNVNLLAREDRWFERGVKESIYVKLERPSVNRGGGLRHFLSPTYNGETHHSHLH